MLKESQNRVRSMALVHEQLHRSRDLSRIHFGEYVRNLTASLFCSYGIDSSTIALRLRIAEAFFTYVAPETPTIGSVSPASGLDAGGTVVTVVGTALGGTTGVTIEGFAATFTVLSDTLLQLVTPGGTAGTQILEITTGAGSVQAMFTYIAPDPDAGRREDVGSAGASPSHATGETRARRYKLRIEAGWGPADRYGFEAKDIPWDMRLDVAGGKVVGAERCFNRFGQRIVSQDGGHVAWHLLTKGRRSQSPGGMTQSIVVEIEGTPDTRLRLTVDDVTTDGLPRELTVADLLAGHCLIPLVEESERRVLDTFGITAEEMINPDPIFHNARKVKLHQAIPEAAYTASATFEGIELLPGRNPLYVRVSQLNGQLAWSSPIWVDAPE